MTNLLTMSPQQIEQQALGIINTMLQQNGIQGGINGVVQQVQGFENMPFIGGKVREIVTNAAARNNVPANGNPSQVLQNALQGNGGFADHASAMLHRSIQQVSQANPSLAGNALATEITNHFIQSAQNDATTRNYLGFVNDIVSQAKGLGQLQGVPTITVEMLRQPLQQQLATLVPQQRETATPQQPETPARSANQERPSTPSAPQTRAEQPAPTTPPRQPTNNGNPPASNTPRAIPAVQVTTTTAPVVPPSNPPQANNSNPASQPNTQPVAANPASTTTQAPPAANQPATPPAPERQAPQQYNAENINNIMRDLQSELRTEEEYYAIQKALDDGFNGRYRNRGGFLDSIGSMFGDIGNVLMGLFAAVMGIFQGRNPIEVFQDYMASDGTGEQMRESLQIIQEMSPVEMGYSDPSTGVTGQDLMEAHAYRMEVVRAQRDVDALLRSRRTVVGHDLEEAYARLDEAEARFGEFDARFQARFGESAETAFKKFEARKEELQYAVANQLGIEARANGLVDTPSAEELMYAYRTNGPAPSLDPRSRETIGRDMARNDRDTRIPSRNERTSGDSELQFNMGNPQQQNFSDPSQYRPTSMANGELSFEVADARVITSPSATPSSRANDRNLELQL